MTQAAKIHWGLFGLAVDFWLIDRKFEGVHDPRAKLCDAAGVSDRVIGRAVNGTSVSMENFAKICKAMNRQPSDFHDVVIHDIGRSVVKA